MAFPVVEGTNTSGQSTNTTSHTIALPAGIVAGETLITYLCAQGISALTFPAGWTLLNIGQGGGFDMVFIHYRKAVGSDADPAVTWTGSQSVSTNSYRISGATDPDVTPPDAAHTNSGLDCPSLSPAGGSKEYLWIVGFGLTGDRVEIPPSPYATKIRFASPSMTMATARRTLEAATENPGLWTRQASGDQETVSTLAVQPESGGQKASSSVGAKAEMLGIV